MDAVDHLKRFLGPMERRLRTMLMRGTLTAVDDGHDLQRMQVVRLEGEVLDDCERVGQYGLASFPLIGSEVIIGQIGSNSDHQVVLGVEDKSRAHPLTEGQTCIYDSAGTKILLDGVGNLTITSAGSVTINASTVILNNPTTMNGDLSVNGDVHISGHLNGHTP